MHERAAGDLARASMESRSVAGVPRSALSCLGEVPSGAAENKATISAIPGKLD